MRRSLLSFLPVLLASALTIAAQGPSASLQTGLPVEKTLAARQTHSYNVRLEKDQFAQLTVEQRGIDVVVRVFGPEGQLILQLDTPTGTEDAEYVDIVADVSGTHRIEVSPLAEGDNVGSGNYQITLTELRKATEQERQIFNNVRTRKAKGTALLIETMQYVDQLRLPGTRVEMRIKAAQLLWDSDPKRASKLIGEAVEEVRRIIAQMIERNEPDYSSYQLVMDMRQRLIRVLAARDPEAALNFFQSTRIPVELRLAGGQMDPELQLEFQLVNETMAVDPKRAFDLAQDLLKRSSSATLIQTLNRLISKDRELAARLARDISAKLAHQQLATSRDAGMLAAGLLNVAGSSQRYGSKNGDEGTGGGLLSADDYRNLFLKIVSEVLSYSPSTAVYSPEHDGVRSLAATLRLMPNELKTYAPDRAALIDKKIAELIGSAEQVNTDWSRFQAAINQPSADAALESASEAPAQMRDYLYQQIATRIANSGDMARAKQIISERIANPSQRQTAFNTLDQQAITTAAEKGRFDEALRMLGKFRPGEEREDLVVQVFNYLDRRVKKQLAVQYLSEGKQLITSASRARNQAQMHRLLSIACVLADYDVNHAFEMVEPLLDQFNEISAAAVTMNGFDRDYYSDGELITSNDNPIAQTASHFSDTLATLAMVDFDRAKTAADGLNRLEVRLRIFLLVAERTMGIALEPDEPTGYNSGE